MNNEQEIIIDSVITAESDANSESETNNAEQNGKKESEMKKLLRSRNNRMICGVCAGIGNYFGIDPTIVRLLFLIFGCTGTGIIAYFIAAAVIPEED